MHAYDDFLAKTDRILLECAEISADIKEGIKATEEAIISVNGMIQRLSLNGHFAKIDDATLREAERRFYGKQYATQLRADEQYPGDGEEL